MSFLSDPITGLGVGLILGAIGIWLLTSELRRENRKLRRENAALNRHPATLTTAPVIVTAARRELADDEFLRLVAADNAVIPQQRKGGE